MKLEESPFLMKDMLCARVTAKDFVPSQWQVGQEAVVRLRQGELLLRQNDQVATLALMSDSGPMDFHAQNLDALWVLIRVKPGKCRRRFNIDHLCRLNIDQGLKLAA